MCLMDDVLDAQIKQLDPQSKSLLYYLAQNKGRYIQADEFPIIGMENVRTLRVYVSRIRSLLGREIIRSRRGKGYVYVGSK